MSKARGALLLAVGLFFLLLGFVTAWYSRIPYVWLASLAFNALGGFVAFAYYRRMGVRISSAATLVLFCASLAVLGYRQLLQEPMFFKASDDERASTQEAINLLRDFRKQARADDELIERHEAKKKAQQQ